MIESIEHQLSAVRAMINLSDDTPRPPRAPVRPAVEPREDVGYLDDSEEDELAKLLQLDVETHGKEQLLADLMGAAAETDPEE
jgi:hypothetical protein